MTADLTFPVGTSEPLDVQLLNDAANLVGTGLTLGLEIKHYVNGVMTTVASPPTVAWLSQAGGTVRITSAHLLAVGSYYVRYTLTDSGGKVGYCPNTKSSDRWDVVPVANR